MTLRPQKLAPTDDLPHGLSYARAPGSFALYFEQSKFGLRLLYETSRGPALAYGIWRHQSGPHEEAIDLFVGFVSLSLGFVIYRKL